MLSVVPGDKPQPAKLVPPIDLVDVYTDVAGSTLILWDLLAERSVENDPNINISHRKLPRFEDHKNFVRGRPYHKWYLLFSELYPDQCLGYVNITPKNEIGIILYKDARDKGVGSAALTALLAKESPLPAIPSVRPGHFTANINPRNARSIALFTKFGFHAVQTTYARER